MLTTQQVFGSTFIVLLLGALAWTCWCWSKAEVKASNAERERDRALDGKLACNQALTLDQYQLLAMRTAKAQAGRDALNHALIGMGSEVGECFTHWKAHLYYGQPLDKAYLHKELGDALWFLQRACGALDFTLEDVARANIGKLMLRYPHAYSNEAALARADEGRAA